MNDLKNVKQGRTPGDALPERARPRAEKQPRGP